MPQLGSRKQVKSSETMDESASQEEQWNVEIGEDSELKSDDSSPKASKRDREESTSESETPAPKKARSSKGGDENSENQEVTKKKPLVKPGLKAVTKPAVSKKDDKSTTTKKPAVSKPKKPAKSEEEGEEGEEEDKQDNEEMDVDQDKKSDDGEEDGEQDKNEESKPKKTPTKAVNKPAAKSSTKAATKPAAKKDDKKDVKKTPTKKPAAKKDKPEDGEEGDKQEGEGDGENKVEKKPKTPRKKKEGSDDKDKPKTARKKTPKKTDEEKAKKDKKVVKKDKPKKDKLKKKSKSGDPDEFEPDSDDQDSDDDDIGDTIPFISRKSCRKSSASAVSVLKEIDDGAASDIDIKRSAEDKAKPKIAGTSLDECDLEVLTGLIGTLKDRKFTNRMGSRVEVVIAGAPKRTFKVLDAIARGLWIVKKEWIYECLEKQAWVPYEKFEAVDYWPAVKTARLAAATNKPALLNNQKFYIFDSKDLPFDQVEDLISAAGGELVDKYEDCDVCISNETLKPEVKGDSNHPVVTQSWLFEAIQTYSLPDHSSFVPKSD